MKVVFFGTSTSAFSNRHFEALLAAPCSIVAVVDAPAGGPASTNTSAAGASFVHRAQATGIPVYAPAKPNAPEFLADACRHCEPDLFLAVGYTGIMRSAAARSPAAPGRELPRLAPARLPRAAPAVLGAAQRRAMGRADGTRDGCGDRHRRHPLPGARAGRAGRHGEHALRPGDGRERAPGRPADRRCRRRARSFAGHKAQKALPTTDISHRS